MPREDTDALLSVAQAATLLGVHPNTLRAWTDNGRLTAYRINARGDRRYRRRDVERLLVEDGAAASAAAHVPPTDPAELAVFARVASGLAASPTPGAVARTAVEALLAELGVAHAAAYVVSGDRAELSAHGGQPNDPPPAVRDVPDAEAVVGDDEVVIRLATRRGPVGLLVIDRPSTERMSAAFLRSLRATLSTSLASGLLLARARREIKRARALRTMLNELTGKLDLGTVLGDVVKLTRSLFEADKAGLWLRVDDRPAFQVAAQHGLGPELLARAEALRGDEDSIGLRAMRGRRTLVTQAAGTAEAGVMSEAYAAEGIRTACLVPMVSGDDVLGLLALYHCTEHPWPQEEIDLAEAFADQAAVAIQNARLYRSVAEQAARMRSIQDLAARLNGLADVRAIAEAIVAEASALAEYHDIRVYRVDWERRMCDPIAFTREMLAGDPADAADLLRVAVGEGFTGWVAEHGEPLLINDALADDRGQTIEGTDDVPESMLVVPMLYEDRAIGVIVLSQLGFDRFSADDLQTMSIFAGYAAQAMANAATYEQLTAQSAELQRRADSQRRLLEINERLLSTLDQAGVLETIADGLRDVVAYDNLSIYRADHQRRVMHPVLTRERHADEVGRYIVPFGRGLMGWAFEHSEPILANDALSDPRAIQVPGTPADPEAVVVVPLIADGEVLGALNVSRVGGPEVYFSDSDFELIQLFAAQASIALRNADAHHAISKLAETDALTGLANHGAFQRDLAQAVEAAATDASDSPSQLAVLMMDLDRFKAYNDRHGHPAGDALLHKVATAIYGAARSEDRVYRYGGDELSMILPGADAVDAARVAERIRRTVSATTGSDGVGSRVTITIGVAAYPADATTRASLIAAADTALYYGKRSGANRVVRADGLNAEVGDLRGTLEHLAEAALRDGDDPHAVEQLVERASRMAAPQPAGSALHEVLLAVTRAMGRHDAAADRSARLAREIAVALGLPPDERARIELAARLASLADAVADRAMASGALGDVAELLRAHRRLTRAGSRRSRRVGTPRGAVGGHVIAVARAYDRLVSAPATSRLGRAQALDALRRDPATFRDDVIDALATAVRGRTDAGRRRRRADRATGVRGAA